MPRMIPPRPWRFDEFHFRIVDAVDCQVLRTGHGVSSPDRETAELIVRLVNTEPEVVALLNRAIEEAHDHPRFEKAMKHVATLNRIFALLRGDAPAPRPCPECGCDTGDPMMSGCGACRPPCAACARGDSVRLRGACEAMSRFLTFVWMEAEARYYLNQFGPPFLESDLRAKTLARAIESGRLRLSWPGGSDE